MSECVLCGNSKLRQPTVPGKPCKFPIVPLASGGAVADHNYISMCRYHEMMYHKWFNDEERSIADKIIRKKMRETFPRWEKSKCTQYEYSSNKVMDKIRRAITK